jgi:glutamate synthase (NADPH/NADH) large chain
VATQDPRLRAKFAGEPEHAMNFMRFVAAEVREWMAQLGFRTIEEMVGHSECLEMRKAVEHWKAKRLDFSQILHRPTVGPEVGHHCAVAQDHSLEKSIDKTALLRICEPALENQTPVEASLAVENKHRVVGTIVGSEITRRYGPEGLPEDTVRLHFKGSAGQSFGAFIPRGMTLSLEGDANDYVGKGLSGGKIIVFPPAGSTFAPEDNVIVGNVALYGATSGEAYLRGQAGERFAVRNSGAHTVVEGTGDHGCEYMTAGRVIVLGPTGRNFAAGMSGGIAYVLDVAGDFVKRCNREMVQLDPLVEPEEVELVQRLLARHAQYTLSTRATAVLGAWRQWLPLFVRVMPHDYRRVIDAQKRMKAKGLSAEEAEMAAFEQNAQEPSRVGGK